MTRESCNCLSKFLRLIAHLLASICSFLQKICLRGLFPKMGSSPPLEPSSASRPHALLIPYPRQGHTNPMMQLGKKLASEGFTVTFVNVELLHERIVQSNTESDRTVSEERELDIRLESLPLTGLGNTNMRHLVRQLLGRLSMKHPRVTCIISDALTSTWTQELADMYHIPRIAFMTCSQAFSLFFFHVLLLRSRAQRPLTRGKCYTHVATETIKDSDCIFTGIPGLPPLRPADIPTFSHLGDKEMYYFFGRQIQHCRKAERVFVNSFYELESLAFDAMSLEVPTYAVGPLLPSGDSGTKDKRSGTSFWPEQDECLQWLDKQPACSVVYVSFGSVTLLSVGQFQEIAMGLEAASGQRFLWVLRPDLIAHGSAGPLSLQDPDRIADVCADPRTFLPEGFLERTSQRGFLVSWAPQLLVLSHPSVGGFLTHCGWNSIVESISNGIPMIAWPYFADQMMNCRFIVHEWKMGMELRAREDDGLVARGEVERAVREMMEGEEGKEMRRRALEMKDAARKSIMEGGDSYNSIKAFVEKMWSEL